LSPQTAVQHLYADPLWVLFRPLMAASAGSSVIRGRRADIFAARERKNARAA